MLNEPYTLLDAMREEIDTLTEMENVSEKQNKLLLASSYRNQARSLQRIVNRFEKGREYYMGIDKEGNPQLKYRQGTRHLEREYPAVAEAKRNFDVVTGLVKGNE
jgi:ABC-type thiamine transport system ATPase subunit